MEVLRSELNKIELESLFLKHLTVSELDEIAEMNARVEIVDTKHSEYVRIGREFSAFEEYLISEVKKHERNRLRELIRIAKSRKSGVSID